MCWQTRTHQNLHDKATGKQYCHQQGILRGCSERQLLTIVGFHASACILSACILSACILSWWQYDVYSVLCAFAAQNPFLLNCDLA